MFDHRICVLTTRENDTSDDGKAMAAGRDDRAAALDGRATVEQGEDSRARRQGDGRATTGQDEAAALEGGGVVGQTLKYFSC